MTTVYIVLKNNPDNPLSKWVIVDRYLTETDAFYAAAEQEAAGYSTCIVEEEAA